MAILFRETDFIDNTRLYCTFLNETSGTYCSKQGSNEIQEIYDDGVRVKALQTSCAIGHSLTIYFFDETLKKKGRSKDPKTREKYSKLTAIGKVLYKEKSGSDHASIIISFSQYDLDQWNDILEANKEVQQRITNEMERLKAHG